MISEVATREIVKAQSRRDAIVRSSREVFLRYGFARTTMEDLARAADMSRPALYLLFPRKEEAFTAVIDDLWQETLRLYQTKLPGLKTLEERLRFLLHHWTGTGYELTSTHPDASDVFDIRYPAVRKMYDELCNFLGGVLSESLARTPARVSPKDLAQAAIFSLRGMKEIVRSRRHMHVLIDLQVDLLLAALRDTDREKEIQG